MMQMLYANAATLPTTTGGGTHGHIGLITQPALYSRSRSNSNIYTWLIRTCTAANNKIMDLALKALIIEAVDAVYLEEKRDRYTGFLTVTARDLMTRLLQRQRYGKITIVDLMTNRRKMDEPLDPSVPIDVYFKRIDECVQFATDAETAYTPEQILQTVYYAISS